MAAAQGINLVGKTRPRTSETHTKHIEDLKTNQDVETILFGSSHFERFLTTGKGLLPRKVAVAGVGGDQVEHMVWRVEQGLFGHSPNLKKVVIVAGGNNITNGQKPQVVAEKVGFLVDLVKKEVGDGVVVEVTDTPVASKKVKKLTEEQVVSVCIDFSKYLRIEMKKRDVFVYDFQERTFSKGPPPKQIKALFDDEVHLNRRGYEIFASVLFPL